MGTSVLKGATLAVVAVLALACGRGPAHAAVEYVKICSLYGAGWNYIPGTDTCLNAYTGETRQQTSVGTKPGQTDLSSRVGDTESGLAETNAALDETNASLAATQDQVNALAKSQAQLEKRFDDAFAEASDGVAMAMALADPDLVGGEHFGIKINWGTFSSSNAFGMTFAGVIAESDKGRVTLSGGVATTGRSTAGRVGMQFSW